jgi:putative phosphoesterase
VVRIGVLSDTHGLLRPSVLAALAGCDTILHAGDVGRPEILAALRAIAPLAVVRGNVDYGAELEDLPLEATGEFDGIAWKMTHRPEDIPSEWFGEARLIVHGHTHRPLVETRGRCLLLNPGSCGPRRFDLPVTLAILRLAGAELAPEILELKGDPRR